MSEPELSDEQAFVMFDRIYQAKGSVPTYVDCHSGGYRGGTAAFNARRSRWARARGIELHSRFRDDVVYTPTDLRKTTEAVRATSKLPTPETERGKHGKPFNPPEECPIQQSVKLYRASWRRIREAGA